jgi:hypothetical protein
MRGCCDEKVFHFFIIDLGFGISDFGLEVRLRRIDFTKKTERSDTSNPQSAIRNPKSKIGGNCIFWV